MNSPVEQVYQKYLPTVAYRELIEELEEQAEECKDLLSLSILRSKIAIVKEQLRLAIERKQK